MIILGINAYHADASAALLIDGELVAAAEEERFNRIKHATGFPSQSIRYCLDAAGASIHDVDHIAISRDPRAHLFRRAFFAMRHRPSLPFLRDRLRNRSLVNDIVSKLSELDGRDTRLQPPSSNLKAKVHYVEHHRAHLASSFFVSPFEEAALLSIDGFGDFVSTMWGIGRENRMAILDRVSFPHSLGLLYTAITQYLGFPNYGDEYKVMGLAAYGSPSCLLPLRKLVRNGKGMHFALDLDYFVHHSKGVPMTWSGGAPLLGKAYSERLVSEFGPARAPGDPIEKGHLELAASLQALLEENVFRLLNALYEKTGTRRLCLAGGVALNCTVNGKIFRNTPFEEVYIQPAAYDGGTSVGAAFYVHHEILRNPRSFEMRHAYWGPEFSDAEIRKSIEENELAYTFHEEGEMERIAAEAIAGGKIVGLFRGRMEFGPRALGNRSIVVDPRRAEMKERLNRRIKHREPFRPFAPSILEESVAD